MMTDVLHTCAGLRLLWYYRYITVSRKSYTDRVKYVQRKGTLVFKDKCPFGDDSSYLLTCLLHA
ncbi:hypothetical protein WN55_06816 [Dufourea novaeangliae]|uniref:Uncharacterized protein n=1 Tax=Dufourea novaeangliae TaxID=178035 RepID=A0A154PST4_DUFNO|nr:hypothetical protein WN55_06816 [Dufourea novaeangliae]